MAHGAPACLCFRSLMKLIRYEDSSGKIHCARETEEGTHLRMEGDPLGTLRETGEPAQVRKRLAPVAPTMIWCIGQNYRLHNKEVGMKLPDYPIVFAKGPNA